ncbi:MAG TPA: hypothetical protein VED86_02780, partial [archaeon]|nr:hypothetical protein [archaeon]
MSRFLTDRVTIFVLGLREYAALNHRVRLKTDKMATDNRRPFRQLFIRNYGSWFCIYKRWRIAYTNRTSVVPHIDDWGSPSDTAASAITVSHCDTAMAGCRFCTQPLMGMYRFVNE